MDSESAANTSKNAPRKVRFAPKVPQRRVSKPVVAKVEKVEDGIDAAQAEELLRRFNETSVKVKPKVERKVGPAQVAFGHAGSSTSVRSFGAPNGINIQQSSYSAGGAAAGHRVEKEYKEPWDYYTNYPLTLPMRRPYSGNPEHRDIEEFGEASESLAYDECSEKTAAELGLMDENMEENMFFLQLPPIMPMLKPPPNTEGSEMAKSSKPPKNLGPSQKACSLDKLPSGFMGKMYVYRSGAVKLKLGDTLYDVSAGLDCVFAQDAVAVNAEEKHCCAVGELNKRAIITPDVESILDSLSDVELDSFS